jgi:hypothetical protein
MAKKVDPETGYNRANPAISDEVFVCVKPISRDGSTWKAPGTRMMANENRRCVEQMNSAYSTSLRLS